MQVKYLIIDKSNLLQYKNTDGIFGNKLSVTEEKVEEINFNKYSIQISIILKNVENKHSSLPDLKEFKGIFLIDDSASKESINKYSLWIEELKNISSKNFLKIYIYCHDNIKIIDEDFKKNLEINKIKFHETPRDGLLKLINDLICNQIKSMNLINLSNDSSSYDLTKNKNSKEEIENKILKSLNQDLFLKTEKELEQCSFLYKNDFKSKIFLLIEKLQKFADLDVEDSYDFMIFLKLEKRNLEDIIVNLSQIASKNENAYFAVYYYYSINRLLNCYDLSDDKKKDNNHDENYEKFEQSSSEKENKDIEDKNDKIELSKEEQMKNIKNNLLKKQEDIIIKLGKLYKPYENIIKKNESVNSNEILSQIDNNIEITDCVKNELNELKNQCLKYKNVLKNLEDYLSTYFTEYLYGLSILLKSIGNTLKYFTDRIINTEVRSGEDIDDFVDFIYFIFNYDWKLNFRKIEEIVDYMEKYFISTINKQYENKTYKIGNYNFKIKDNTLIQFSGRMTLINLENIDNYCLDLINKYKLCGNDYLNQKYLWFLKFRKNNYFEKNKKIFEEFFQTIFKKNSMKDLMKKIFPYLKQNYIINEKFISDFFKKIRAYNFRPKFHCGETITATLEVFVKGYFEMSDSPSDICAVASYVIIIFHEFAHYTRIYLYNLTGDKIYRKSKGLCEQDEIGDYFEKLLFGEKSDIINLIQAIYLLDENNYNNNYELFAEGYQKIKNDVKNKTAKVNIKNTPGIIKNLKLSVSQLGEIDFSKDFPVRTGNHNFIIGNYNDKGGRSADLNKIFAGTAFE